MRRSRHSGRTALSATFVALDNPTQHAPALGLFFPEAEGAVGGGADDTAAVLATFAAASAAKTLVEPYTSGVFAPGGTVMLQDTYNLDSLTGPIVASCNIDGRQGSLVAPNAYDDVVLLVGADTSGEVLQNARVHLPEIRKDGAVTSHTAGSVGVQSQNIYASEIRGHRTIHFETGWWLTGLGHGTAYNQINVGWIDLCEVGLKFVTQTGGGSTRTPSSPARSPSPEHLRRRLHHRRPAYRVGAPGPRRHRRQRPRQRQHLRRRVLRGRPLGVHVRGPLRQPQHLAGRDPVRGHPARTHSHPVHRHVHQGRARPRGW